MKTGLLTSSSCFGKYLPNETAISSQSESISTINLKQNFTHERPFVSCKFDIMGNRLYLLDTSGTLVNLNLQDNSFSTLKSQKIQNFTVNGSNSLSILFVNNRSELFQVSFDNKKPIKITNLNMNKILAFEKNDLREMLLCLDYKILFLCDVNRPGPLRVKSLKAKNSEIFTNACFASNNRFIILTTKVQRREIENSIIKIIEIMDLKTVHEIKLPFSVNDIKIQVSYDSKRVAIYGDCNIVFFINLHENQTYSYELIEISFVKSVVSLKYTSEGDIIFLGSDQVLYGISNDDLEKAVPLFNQEFQIRTMDFDISENCDKIALVSNRTVMQVKFSNGIHYEIEQSPSYKQIDYVKNGFEPRKNYDEIIIEEHNEEGTENKLPLDNESEEEEDDDDVREPEKEKETINIDNLVNTSGQIYREECGPLHEAVAELKGVSSHLKAETNSILNNLISHHNVSSQNASELVNIIVKLLKEENLSPEEVFNVTLFVVKSLEQEKHKIRHYGVILCPEITAVIEKKFNIDFTTFSESRILSLFSKYFVGNEWREALNWLVSPGVNENPDNLPLLFICILGTIQEKVRLSGIEDSAFLDGSELNITFSEIYNKLVKLYVEEKYKNLFAKKKTVEPVLIKEVEPEESGNSRLETLIQKQDEIKKAILSLKKPNFKSN